MNIRCHVYREGCTSYRARGLSMHVYVQVGMLHVARLMRRRHGAQW